MEKIQIKTEKLTSFGGNFPIMEQIQRIPSTSFFSIASFQQGN